MIDFPVMHNFFLILQGMKIAHDSYYACSAPKPMTPNRISPIYNTIQIHLCLASTRKSQV